MKMTTEELLIKLANRLEVDAKSITSRGEASDAMYYTLMTISREIIELVNENE